ncbi:hypothetical protein PQR25_19445 [Paraburkholderia nemoris]|uniref:hypothetical protein n=1 Tax=Paraburkholderia nemoris TaxID=2793076 RepID=UPI0038B85DED
MSEFSYFRVPYGSGLCGWQNVATRALDGERFAAHQIEFTKLLFGYSVYLRDVPCESPLADAFFATMLYLLETLDENSPAEANRCAIQLKQFIESVFASRECRVVSSPRTGSCHVGVVPPERHASE